MATDPARQRKESTVQRNSGKTIFSTEKWGRFNRFLGTVPPKSGDGSTDFWVRFHRKVGSVQPIFWYGSTDFWVRFHRKVGSVWQLWCGSSAAGLQGKSKRIFSKRRRKRVGGEIRAEKAGDVKIYAKRIKTALRGLYERRTAKEEEGRTKKRVAEKFRHPK